MPGMHHDVGAVKRRPFGVVIEERTASGENIPWIVDMKIHQAQSQGEVDSSHCIMSFVNGSELTLGEDLSVIFEFVDRVGDLRGVYQLANLDDGLVVRGGDQTDFIIGWKHRRPPISVREKHSWLVYTILYAPWLESCLSRLQ